MAGAASVSACLLALVFLWAAVAKLVGRGATAAAFAALGVPRPGAAAVGVPVVELLVAVLLVVRPDVGASLALALLAVFTLAVVRAVASGSRAGCACFGARRAEPVSPADVVRNGLLAAFAAVATGTARLVRPGVAPVVGVVLGMCAGGFVLRLAQRRLGPS